MTTTVDGLTEAEVESFRQNGFVGPFDLYDPDDAVRRWNKAKIEMVLSRNKPHNSTTINYDRHLDCGHCRSMFAGRKSFRASVV